MKISFIGFDSTSCEELRSHAIGIARSKSIECIMVNGTSVTPTVLIECLANEQPEAQELFLDFHELMIEEDALVHAILNLSCRFDSHALPLDHE